MLIIRRSILSLFAIPIIIGSALFFINFDENSGLPKKPAQEETISIVCVGDIMMGSSFPDNSTLPPNKGAKLFDAVSSYIYEADIACGNLEGVLLDDGQPYKVCKDSTQQYLFRQPTYNAANLKNAGFDFLSVANNHLNDFGPKGIKSTAKVLSSEGILTAGVKWQPTVVGRFKGISVGFAAFSFNSNTIHINDTASIAQVLAKLNRECKLVIVSFHGGVEGRGAERVVNENESYFDEKRGNSIAFARFAIDHGADIVYGHGPHMSRAMEVYKDRLIAYSLGNFCTPSGMSLKGSCGIAPLVQVTVTSEGRFLYGSIIATKQKRFSGPLIDQDKTVIKKLQKLTKIAFPNGTLIIADDGKLSTQHAEYVWSKR